MTASGYIFLAIGWGIVLWLSIFSVARLIGRKKS
jgi:hypothetical protein